MKSRCNDSVISTGSTFRPSLASRSGPRPRTKQITTASFDVPLCDGKSASWQRRKNISKKDKHGLLDCVILRNGSNGETTGRESDVGRLADFERFRVEGGDILKSSTTGGVIRSITITKHLADEGSKIIVDTCIGHRVVG